METDPTLNQTPSEGEMQTPLLPKPEPVPLLPSGTQTEAELTDWNSCGGVIEGTIPTDLGC